MDCCFVMQGKQQLTGTVLDIGDGVAHVIPVADGFVIGSNIKSMPLAGRNVTGFIQQLMRLGLHGKIES